MVLSKRFSMDINSKLPAVEEAKDAEEQEEVAEHSPGGVSSRPHSHLSTASIVPKSSGARSPTEKDETHEHAEVSESVTSVTPPEDCVTSEENQNNWDTDLEIEEVKQSYDPSGKAKYLSACKFYGVVPVSYYLRHMGDSELVMRHHGLGAQATKAISVSLVTNTSVVNLNLSDNWIGADGAAAVADMLKENCYISELHLCDNKLGLEGAKALSLMLMENITLQKVNLSGNEFDDQASTYFSDAIMNNQKVELMDLSHNMFGDGSGESFGAAIAENTGMLELNLSWNHFRGKGAVSVAKGLGANLFLRILDLSYNGFGNDGAAALGDALKVNNVLEELNISNNRIALQGAVRFALCLKENKILRVLKMARNPIQSDGCFAVLKAIQANTESAIESLDFSDIVVNKQFDDLYNNMKITMPNMNIKLGGNSEMFKRSFPKANPMHKVKQYAKENNLQLDQLFSNMADNRSGLLTHEDFERELMSTGIIMSKEEIQQLIDFLDKDKSGKIELSALLKTLST